MLKKIFKEKSDQPTAGFLGPKNDAEAQVVGENGAAAIPQSAKLQDVLAAVDKVAAKQDSAKTDFAKTDFNADGETVVETVADDIALPAEKQALIQADEAVIRAALALFGHDYDALIKLDNTSVYGRAVAANPQILDAVGQAERPVLAALKVAVEMQPYVDFMDAYGSSPAEIKAAIAAEALGAKQKSAAESVPAEDAGAPKQVLPFSYGACGQKGDAAGGDKTAGGVEAVFGGK